MKNFEIYLNIIQEEREMISEGKISDALITGLMALSIMSTNLNAKNKSEAELHQALQDHIEKVIEKQKIKKEELEVKIKEILQSKQTGDFNESEYKKFIDEIVKNKSIKIGQKEYQLNLTEKDRDLVDEIFGGRKTYEMNPQEAAKFILNKINIF